MPIKLEALELYTITLTSEEGFNFLSANTETISTSVTSSVSISYAIGYGTTFNSSSTSSSSVSTSSGASLGFNSIGTSETFILPGLGEFITETFESSVVSSSSFSFGIAQTLTFNSIGTAESGTNVLSAVTITSNQSATSSTSLFFQEDTALTTVGNFNLTNNVDPRTEGINFSI